MRRKSLESFIRRESGTDRRSLFTPLASFLLSTLIAAAAHGDGPPSASSERVAPRHDDSPSQRTPVSVPGFALEGNANAAPLLVAPAADGAGVAPGQRVVTPSSLLSASPTHTLRTDRIVVKLREGARFALTAGRLALSTTDPAHQALRTLLADHPDLEWQPHFPRDRSAIQEQRRAAELQTGHALPDLSSYVRVKLPRPDANAADRLVRELSALPIVQTAFREPIPEPAVSFVDAAPREGSGPRLETTPDYRVLQRFLDEAPLGIGASAIRPYLGATGEGVRLIDIEADWLWSHEDLRQPFYNSGPTIEGWRNHGTAVVGVMIGDANDGGITGIVPDLEVGGVSFAEIGVAAAIDLAASQLSPGDLILIELHAAGPNAGQGGGQFGYVPMEWWQDVFDAIQVATANGCIVVEAGGNGRQNLDDPVYQGMFDRSLRDSGAILVGAGNPFTLAAESFSNYGSRVDLHGWGSSITTAGYGTLQGGEETRWYTSGFGGTSGASPMIAGAAASIQGMARALWGVTLDRDLILEILRTTGTPATGTKAIGPRPDLVQARERLLYGVSELHGIVRSRSNEAPIAGARLRIPGSSRWVEARDDGSYSVPVFSGPQSIFVEEYFHETKLIEVAPRPRQYLRRDIWLETRPTGRIDGVIRDRSGTPVSAPVALLDTPIPEVWSDANGSFTIDGVPEQTSLCRFGPVPGSGAAVWVVTLHANQVTECDVQLPAAVTFESDFAGFTGTGSWAWGDPDKGVRPYSGSRAWMTGLVDPYGNDEQSYLTSPVQDLSGASSLWLSFVHWYDLEAAWDGGQVEVWDGSSWIRVDPLGGYPVEGLSGLDWQPGWSGRSDGFECAIFDLSGFAGPSFRFRFRLGTDESGVAAGWMIDDASLAVSSGPTAVQEDPATRITLESISPQPAIDTATIRFAVDRSQPVAARILDASGRLIRVLNDPVGRAGPRELQWDGRDHSGRSVPAGVYWVRIGIEDGHAATGRILYVR